ncbi:Heterokaryon incompatibility protein 6,OR allele [Lachnellula subtilissima]|uniref:Heterokaryon incompatibility protein 6,OR allele n=1 Tax=Lachnellula subtilissima TaxID=602034 RepID=A0A8H8UBL8_9HELO|nr:Heterokaryon incompatibility protein 6,OR allele [Lachnellula subtilissima]
MARNPGLGSVSLDFLLELRCGGSFEKSPVSLLRPPRYEYQPLPSQRHVRLLELQKSASDNLISYRLVPYLLDDLPPYQALSYTWGDDKPASTIFLDGTWFGVTTNVQDFLSRLKEFPFGAGYIWIDAICINQADNHEKVGQLQMMGEIYHRASNVIVWLGESDDATAAMNLVRRVSHGMREVSPFWVVHPIIRVIKFLTRAFQSVASQRIQDRMIDFMGPLMRFWVKHQTTVPWGLIAKLVTPLSTAKHLLKRALPESKTIDPEWHALINLLHHPWFERIWVRQEAVFASTITVMYGSELVHWESLNIVVEALCSTWMSKQYTTLTTAEATFARRSLPSEMIHLRQIENMRSIEGTSGIKQSLFDLLFRFSRCKSTNRKDKVFALMGLSHEAERDRMLFGGLLRICPSLPTAIDYDKSDRDVFVETAQNMLTREASAFRVPLDILPLAGIGYPTEVQNLPSWAPDWSCVPPAYTLAYHLAGEIYSYRASGKHSDPYVYNGPEGSELILAATGVPVESQKLLGMMPGRTTSPYVRLGSVPDSIEIEAIILGEAAHLGPVWEMDLVNQDTASCLLDAIKWRQEGVDLVSKWATDPYFTGEVLPEAFWRTLIGNRCPTERPAPPIYQQHGNNLEVTQQILKSRLNGEDLGDITELLAAEFPAAMFEDVQEQILDSFSLPYAVAMNQCSLHRRFCVTNNGLMALVPAGTKDGDVVCVIRGAQTPFILRPVEGWTCQLVGECYVHGIMDGEMMNAEYLKTILII